MNDIYYPILAGVIVFSALLVFMWSDIKFVGRGRRAIGLTLCGLFVAIAMFDAYNIFHFYLEAKDSSVVAIPLLTFVAFIPLSFGIRILRQG